MMREGDRPIRRRPRRLRFGLPLCAIFVGVVLAVGAVKLSGPLGTVRRQQDELLQLRRERAALAAEQGRLRAYKRHLASRAGQEEAARRAGYVRPGERRLVFVREPDAESEGVTPAPEEAGSR